MLEINNLHCKIEGRSILNGVNLKVNKGEIHAIMGPNGSGKSTLANVLSGKNGYEISGELKYQGKSLKEISIDEESFIKKWNQVLSYISETFFLRGN